MEKIHIYLSQSKPDEIDTDIVPAEAMEFFINISKRFNLPSDYEKRVKLLAYYKINHTDPDYISYICHANCIYDKTSEQQLYIFEVTPDGTKIGHGEVRYASSNSGKTDDYFDKKPFVGFTSTQEGFQKQGYAKRRLYDMQKLSIAFFGFPINSDTIVTEYAKQIREVLTATGDAKKYLQGKSERYVLITT